MKNFVLPLMLSLGLSAWAAPYTSKEGHFRADFGGKVEYERHHKPEEGWIYSHDEQDSSNVVAILKTPKPMTRYQGLKWLQSNIFGLPIQARVAEISVGGRPGLELQGINPRGVPYSVRLVTVDKKLYVIGSRNMNLAAQRDFLNSFRLLP